jgi:DNA-binding beta-propeller fold protein YncE
LKVRRAITISLFGLVVVSGAATAFEFRSGDLYSSSYYANTISHYTAGGGFIETLTMPIQAGSDTRGLAFGPDGLLYVVMAGISDFRVVAITASGGIQATYSGLGYVGNNLSFGKIAFGTDGRFYVTAGDNLVAFTPGTSHGSLIYTNNQVFDVKAMPSSNLLVLSGYQLQEITTAGSVVRTITPDTITSLYHARGLEYDPLTNYIYVTMLGDTSASFQLMRLDGATGHVSRSVYFVYGDDIFLTTDRRLIVGSRVQQPAIFDLNLTQIGALSGGQQMFVTQMPPVAAIVPAAVPALARELSALMGVFLLIVAATRLRKA